MTTITIKNSQGVDKTFPAPTKVNPYPGATARIVRPADGAPIVMIPASRGSRGEKAAPRELYWNLLPQSAPAGYTFTGTLEELVALEGVETTLTLPAAYGGLYQTPQAITVSRVVAEEAGNMAGVVWYEVRLEFVEQ